MHQLPILLFGFMGLVPYSLADTSPLIVPLKLSSGEDKARDVEELDLKIIKDQEKPQISVIAKKGNDETSTKFEVLLDSGETILVKKENKDKEGREKEEDNEGASREEKENKESKEDKSSEDKNPDEKEEAEINQNNKKEWEKEDSDEEDNKEGGEKEAWYEDNLEKLLEDGITKYRDFHERENHFIKFRVIRIL